MWFSGTRMPYIGQYIGESFALNVSCCALEGHPTMALGPAFSWRFPVTAYTYIPVVRFVSVPRKRNDSESQKLTHAWRGIAFGGLADEGVQLKAKVDMIAKQSEAGGLEQSVVASRSGG
jgi:hypothetical protein